MTEPRPETQVTSDGYRIHVVVWPANGPVRGRVVVLHGVQSHEGWYHRLGQTLAEAGYEAHFPDRRGSGANQVDRGHTPSARRLVRDIAERLATIRGRDGSGPIALAGISWGGKLAVITAADHPEHVDALALIAPGLRPRVGVTPLERLRIALAYFVNRRKRFPIPLSDPALFTASPEGQAFIASDPFGLREATAGLLAASTFIDRMLRSRLRLIRQPSLLMLAGHDRIVDNDATQADFEKFSGKDREVILYPEAHHTLEFEPDPSRYALDLVGWLNQRFPANTPTAECVNS